MRDKPYTVVCAFCPDPHETFVNVEVFNLNVINGRAAKERAAELVANKYADVHGEDVLTIAFQGHHTEL